MTGGVTRRSVIAASLAALPVSAPLLAVALSLGGVSATAGCGVSAAPRPAAKPPSDVSILRSAIAAKKKMIALYTATGAAHPSLAPQLSPLLRDNEAHLKELERRLIHPGAAPSDSTPSARRAKPSEPVAPGRAAALAALRSAEAGAAAVHTRQLLTAAPSLAQLLASIAAAEAAHAALLSGETSAQGHAFQGGVLYAALYRAFRGARVGAQRASAVSALQAALAAEHSAVYGYGVAGAHLAGRQRSAATRAWNAHRAVRDELVTQLAASGVKPVAAADAYQLPFAVRSPHAAALLAADLEDRVTRAYLGLVAVPDTALRTFGALAMQKSAVRAAIWRGSTVALPGLPRSALASAVPAPGTRRKTP